MVQGGGHLPHCVDSLPGGVFGLAIQILYAALGLMHLATDLCLGIASGTSKGFLYFSSQIFGRSTQAIFVHGDAPAVWLHANLSRLGGLPIAPTHATNEKPDTKRYDRRCVRTFFDRMADIIVSIHRAVADRLGGI
jgi:hypothetical protein